MTGHIPARVATQKANPTRATDGARTGRTVAWWTSHRPSHIQCTSITPVASRLVMGTMRLIQKATPHPATYAALMVHALSRAVWAIAMPCKSGFCAAVSQVTSAVKCACLHFTHASSKLVVGTMGSTQKEIAKRSCFHGTGAAPDVEAETAVAPSAHAREKTDIVFGWQVSREVSKFRVLTFQLVNQMLEQTVLVRRVKVGARAFGTAASPIE
jgi:hypothetical protein